MRLFSLCSFLLFLLPIVPLQGQITMQQNEEGVLVLDNKHPVLFYQTTPKSQDGQFERTNYIHPLWNVNGTVLTEDFPDDHLHHRGVFWAWHQILIDGKRIGDGWALDHFTQEVTDADWEGTKNGSGHLSTRVLWKSDLYTKTGKPTPYMEERAQITVHPQKENYRKIDFTIRLSALEKPVSIGGSEDDKGYSGFSVRMKLPEDVSFSGPNGAIKPERTAVESPGFVNISGTFDAQHPGGIVIIDHSDNPRYPQSWILREKKSMQNAKYPGKEPVVIDPEQPLVLKYSLITYQGTLSGTAIKDITKN